MKRNTIVILIVSAILVAGIIVAGCLQDNGSSSGQSAGAQAPPPSGTPPVGSQYQNRFQNILSNTTVLTAAAEKLGVTEQQVENAFNTTQGQGHVNLTVAAQQLGVTVQQLADALGMHFNASMGRHNYTPPS